MINMSYFTCREDLSAWLYQVEVINAALQPWTEALRFNYRCWGAPGQQEIRDKTDWGDPKPL